MLAHEQGGQLNASRLATSLMVTTPTLTRYIDLLGNLLLVRRMRRFHRNAGKRLVKSPKVYVRDSGPVHALLGIRNYGALSGHPAVGTSWEGFVIENLSAVPPHAPSPASTGLPPELRSTSFWKSPVTEPGRSISSEVSPPNPKRVSTLPATISSQSTVSSSIPGTTDIL